MVKPFKLDEEIYASHEAAYLIREMNGVKINGLYDINKDDELAIMSWKGIASRNMIKVDGGGAVKNEGNKTELNKN